MGGSYALAHKNSMWFGGDFVNAASRIDDPHLRRQSKPSVAQLRPWR